MNFRDLGGYPTRDGRSTRWGLMFRADALAGMTAADLVVYETLSVRSVYDLRGDAERQARPDPFPSEARPLIAGIGTPTPAGRTGRTARDGEGFLRDLYQGMLEGAAPYLGRLLTDFADPPHLPAVVHCTGGKDRTGVVAAVLLEALGVPREVVLDDYELTSRYRRREHQASSFETLLAAGLAPEAAGAVLGAPRWAMADALGWVDRDHGDVAAYLTGPAGMDPEAVARLRDLLVG